MTGATLKRLIKEEIGGDEPYLGSAVERLAFAVDSRAQTIISGDINCAKKKASPKPPPKKQVP